MHHRPVCVKIILIQSQLTIIIGYMIDGEQDGVFAKNKYIVNQLISYGIFNRKNFGYKLSVCLAWLKVYLDTVYFVKIWKLKTL